jgi:hypothetical protein
MAWSMPCLRAVNSVHAASSARLGPLLSASSQSLGVQASLMRPHYLQQATCRLEEWSMPPHHRQVLPMVAPTGLTQTRRCVVYDDSKPRRSCSASKSPCSSPQRVLVRCCQTGLAACFAWSHAECTKVLRRRPRRRDSHQLHLQACWSRQRWNRLFLNPKLFEGG